MHVADTMFGALRSTLTCSLASIPASRTNQLSPGVMASWIRVRDICFKVRYNFLPIGTHTAYSPVFAAEPKRVMILHSFGADFKPWSDYARAIHSETESAVIVAVGPCGALARSCPLSVLTILKARLSNTFAPSMPIKQLDLIISIGAPAAAFIQRHRQQLFLQLPCCSRWWTSAALRSPNSRRTMLLLRSRSTILLPSRISCGCCQTQKM